MALAHTFSKFGHNHKKDLILQGDATIEDNIIQLTSVDEDGNPRGASVGRVLLSDPVHLYDRHGRLTSFETTFVFRISSPDADFIPGPGDGLAFFLANADTEIPPDSFGKYLGLFNSASDKVVAVEFDTYPNPEIGDPCFRHVGIDINSVKSSAFRCWNWQDGAIVTATVTYNSASRRLSVRVSDNPTDTLTHSVDLSRVLPRKVRVGLSASTGQYAQTNEVLSWSFKSN